MKINTAVDLDKNFKCRLCIYLHRYRYTHTKDRFGEYAERFNIKV